MEHFLSLKINSRIAQMSLIMNARQMVESLYIRHISKS
jgi:hypothetical protein